MDKTNTETLSVMEEGEADASSHSYEMSKYFKVPNSYEDIDLTPLTLNRVD